MEILEQNSTNWLILTDDGSTETKTKSSNLNQLLYGHDLFGLLQTGDEIWMKDGEEGEPSVTVIPDDKAECYTLRLGDFPDLTLGAQRKTDLVDALKKVYERHDGESVTPIIDLYENVRGNMVRAKVLRPFLDVLGDKVEERDDGWFINGHLLLTFEGEFYHPNNVSRTRSGSIIGRGTSVEAYKCNVGTPERGMQRKVELNGETYRLTDSEMSFIAKAMWGIKNAPDER